MWLTRFQDRSSVSTKTKFGRERSWIAAGFTGWVAAAGEVQPATAAKTTARMPITALGSFPVL